MIRTRFTGWLAWQPQPAELLARMRPIKPWPLHLERFSKGIDNTNIDVWLSARFRTLARDLVQVLVNQDVATRYWGSTPHGHGPQDWDEFRSSYLELMGSTIGPNPSLVPDDAVRLAQLAVFKLFLLLVPEEIQGLKQSLESRRDEQSATTNGSRLEYHERLVILSREERQVAYRVHRRLFGVVERLETAQLAKLRQARLGVAWPLPQNALFNSLVILPGLVADEVVMTHYPALWFADDGQGVLGGLNRCLTETLQPYLPSWVQATEAAAGDVREAPARGTLRVGHRLDQGMLPGFLATEMFLGQLLAEQEYRQPLYSWLDDPGNLRWLLGIKQPGTPTSDRERGDNPPLSKQWLEFNSLIRQRLHERMRAMGINEGIFAAYWTPRIVRELSGAVPASLVYQVISGQQDRRRLLRRLGSENPGLDANLVNRMLDSTLATSKQLSPDDWGHYYDRLLVDFLTLRRDLKLAFKLFEAMDQIRLRTDPKEVNLSRTNGLLYEFAGVDEQTVGARMGAHVILKADVRGSTRITSELRARKLNPATHFSEHFFNPINALLPDFDASKVFVEGDAVILCLVDQLVGSRRGLAVAQACSLALRILEVVQKQNILNRQHQLPVLEIGLGIAYCAQEPTFLYDEDRKIMISPAINLADRLSSCSQTLRRAPFAKAQRPFRVEVVKPDPDGDSSRDEPRDPRRFNLNGVALHEGAFNKLQHELILRRLELEVSGNLELFHVGSFPNRANQTQWMVIRDAPVRAWRNQDVIRDSDQEDRFYELVVDPALITLIRSKLRTALGTPASTPQAKPDSHHRFG